MMFCKLLKFSWKTKDVSLLATGMKLYLEAKCFIDKKKKRSTEARKSKDVTTEPFKSGDFNDCTYPVVFKY